MSQHAKPDRKESDALIALFRQGRHEQALQKARLLAARFPQSLSAWNIRGASARALGYFDEAKASFRQLEQLSPNFAGGPYNLGLVLEDLGDVSAARSAYERAIAITPELAAAHSNLAGVLNKSADYKRAIEHLMKALRLSPDLVEAFNNLGNAFKGVGQYEKARTAYRRAIELNPDFVAAQYNLGVLEQEHGDPKKAVTAFQSVLEKQPEHILARAMLLHQWAQNCDWDAVAQYCGDIGVLGGGAQAVPPFPLLALEDNPAHQLVRSQNWARHRYGDGSSRRAACPVKRPQRLKIGYFSADFHNHPTMQLAKGFLREHDRARFEIHGFSYGVNRKDEGRQRAEQLCDGFHDVHGQADAEIVQKARDEKLDIAVDLNGYSRDSRSGLFAHGLAPLHIGFLGYPSTMGGGFVDYLVVDANVVPVHQRQHYSEKLIVFPETYFPGDCASAITEPYSTRQDHALPEDGFVFCCFNNPYKITEREFDIWMRALLHVEDSVLWLMSTNDAAMHNLRHAAQLRGVASERLIFAPRIDHANHLERHRHADMFLDTFNYNAHTTAIDALWAGLPLVTLQGQQWAARGASGIVKALGMGELVALSEAEYEARIIDYARDADMLKVLRQDLDKQRLTAPLFNTAHYTRQLEQGFERAYDRVIKGWEPVDIKLS